MIWLLGIGLILAVSLYLVAPFLAREVSSKPSAELSSYRDELRAIEQSEEPDAAKKAILQARLLKAARASASLWSPPRREPKWCDRLDSIWAYFDVGRGYRSRFTSLWTRAGLELNDTPDIRKEYEAAKTFAAQTQNGPSAEDIAAMQNLSEEDRTAAIQGMVDSLRARLETNPTDAQGWVRLLRSRKVLGQTQAGEADIAALRVAMPDQADAIIAQSGWEEWGFNYSL